MENNITKEKFLKKFDIPVDEFEKTKLDWNQLSKIREDYEKNKNVLEPIAKYIIENLRDAKNVHSIKYRIKDPDKLLIKIIRKKIDDPKREITIENYRSEITDLIGIRVLHLFKKEWKNVGDFIYKVWNLYETPIIYKRKGEVFNLQDEDKDKYKIINHEHDYRSVHFIVESMPDKEMHVAEIQVRTIIEEAWSEIDHKVRYPMKNNEFLLNEFLSMFNNLTGSADEMGSFVMNLKGELDNFQQKVKKMEDDLSESNLSQEKLKEIVAGLNKSIKDLKSPTNLNYIHSASTGIFDGINSAVTNLGSLSSSISSAYYTAVDGDLQSLNAVKSPEGLFIVGSKKDDKKNIL